MSHTTRILILGLLPVLATVAGASTSGARGDASRTIEIDMRQAGCFAPPIATVRDSLRSADTFCRFRAVRVLGLRGEKEAISDLKSLQQNDTDPGVRSQAAVELARLGETGYSDAAREAMDQSPTLSGRVSLAGQLAGLGDASGLRHVEEACGSTDAQQRRSCVSVLGQFSTVAERDPQLLVSLADRMLTLAEDADPSVRQPAVYTLAGYAREIALPETVVTRLEEVAAASADPQVKQAARTAVEDQKRRKHESKDRQ